MIIWIDGDACPNAIKQILFKTAIKRKIKVVIVANHFVATPSSYFIQKIHVSAGFNQADDHIVSEVNSNDLVITTDIVLASEVIAKKALVINPRGFIYDANNIHQMLGLRQVNQSLRENGLIKGEHAPLSAKDIQNFANQLDRNLSLINRR